jgi:sigma-B regulation protein RsbU (phosphoserine phosphatase)
VDTGTLRFPAEGALLHDRSIPFEPNVDELAAGERDVLEAIGTRLVVPLRAKGESVGFLSLGAKSSEEPYDDDDREFLAMVADQLGLGLASLRLSAQQVDLDDATAIQRRLLPTTIPQRRGVAIAASWQPAKAIGGDYYDVLGLSDTLLGLCIGDVVGKGVPAALLMANLQAAVKAVATAALPPRDLVARVNRIIGSNIGPGKFITFFYAVLDAESKTLVFTNAGHNPPLLTRADGSFSTLDDGGPVLGVFETISYDQGSVELKTGDRLTLFTDGVTELWNSTGAEFGDDGLLEVIRTHQTLDAAALEDAITQAVTAFSHGDFQDDVTLVVVAVN